MKESYSSLVLEGRGMIPARMRLQRSFAHQWWDQIQHKIQLSFKDLQRHNSLFLCWRRLTNLHSPLSRRAEKGCGLKAHLQADATHCHVSNLLRLLATLSSFVFFAQIHTPLAWGPNFLAFSSPSCPFCKSVCLSVCLSQKVTKKHLFRGIFPSFHGT